MGGEEFLLILPGATTAHTARTAGRLLDAISKVPIHTMAGPLLVTASAGAVATDLGHADAETLLGASDAALYRAKRDGRACVRTEQGAPMEDSDFPPSEPDTMKAPD